MRTLYIVGAGGFGREVLTYAHDVLVRDPGAYTLGGFIDDRLDATDGWSLPVAVGVVARPDEIVPHADDRYVIAVGDPIARKQLADRLAARGARFATVIHPMAYVAPTATLEDGCVVAPFAFIGPGCRLAAHVVLNTYASTGHDAVVAAFSVFSPYAVVNGHAVVEEGVFFGTHATAIVGTRVGAWSKLAAGAIAFRDVPPRSLAIGNPAKARELFAAPPDPAKGS